MTKIFSITEQSLHSSLTNAFTIRNHLDLCFGDLIVDKDDCIEELEDDFWQMSISIIIQGGLIKSHFPKWSEMKLFCRKDIELTFSCIFMKLYNILFNQLSAFDEI